MNVSLKPTKDEKGFTRVVMDLDKLIIGRIILPEKHAQKRDHKHLPVTHNMEHRIMSERTLLKGA
jgi:hypothetical protein